MHFSALIRPLCMYPFTSRIPTFIANYSPDSLMFTLSHTAHSLSSERNGDETIV